MTEKELCKELGIKVFVFEDSLFEDEAFFIPGIRTMFLSDKIIEEDRIKTILHEIGHKNHLPHLYAIFREKYELEANRAMIQQLIRLEIEACEDKEHFNFLAFMQKYKLKTIADEAMVKEEYNNLVSNV